MFQVHVMLRSSLRSRNHGNPMRQEYVPSSCYVMFTFTLCSKFTFMLCHAQVHVQIMHVHVQAMFQVTFMLSFSFSLSYVSYVMLYVKLCYDYL